MKDIDIRFVIVPFAPYDRPTLGVSILSALAQVKGYKADTCYYNYRYLQEKGFSLYDDMYRNLPQDYLFGEALFVKALWGNQAPAWKIYQGSVKYWACCQTLKILYNYSKYTII